jgi:hypothetical protein
MDEDFERLDRKNNNNSRLKFKKPRRVWVRQAIESELVNNISQARISYQTGFQILVTTLGNRMHMMGKEKEASGCGAWNSGLDWATWDACNLTATEGTILDLGKAAKKLKSKALKNNPKATNGLILCLGHLKWWTKSFRTIN